MITRIRLVLLLARPAVIVLLMMFAVTGVVGASALRSRSSGGPRASAAARR